MAKKSTKPNREKQYREIIENAGRNWNDCTILGFLFKYQTGIEMFHYCLMVESEYFLFDNFERYVNIVVPKDEKNAARIIKLAKQNGGENMMPNLL